MLKVNGLSPVRYIYRTRRKKGTFFKVSQQVFLGKMSEITNSNLRKMIVQANSGRLITDLENY